MLEKILRVPWTTKRPNQSILKEINSEYSLLAQLEKNLPAVQETPVQFLGWKIHRRRDKLPTPVFLGFPGGSDGKESACNVADLGYNPGLGRYPGGRHGNPLQYSCLENPHGQRSLVGYSPWGYKESDMTERLSTTFTGRTDVEAETNTLAT